VAQKPGPVADPDSETDHLLPYLRDSPLKKAAIRG
jgi:hypothetical protein